MGVRVSSLHPVGVCRSFTRLPLSVLYDLLGLSFCPPPRPPFLTQMFPRHILEHMMAAAEKEPGETPASVDHLAHSHQNVTIMFMDIVGECMHEGKEGEREPRCGGLGQVAGRVYMGAAWGGLMLPKVNSAINSFVDHCVSGSHAHTGIGRVGLK